MLTCTKETPWDRVAKGPVQHDAAHEVGEQEDGWPGGDMVTYECSNCGHRWRAELPGDGMKDSAPLSQTTAQHNAQGMANREPIPPHPLVVDAVTGLCRYASQADIRRMEMICDAHEELVRIVKNMLEITDQLQGRIAND